MTTSQVIPSEVPSTHKPNSQHEMHTGEMAQLGIYAIFCMRATVVTPDILRVIERKDRVVLLLLDGKRTIQDIVRLIHRSDLEVARSLIRLLKHGYAEYIGQRAI